MKTFEEYLSEAKAVTLVYDDGMNQQFVYVDDSKVRISNQHKILKSNSSLMFNHRGGTQALADQFKWTLIEAFVESNGNAKEVLKAAINVTKTNKSRWKIK